MLKKLKALVKYWTDDIDTILAMKTDDKRNAKEYWANRIAARHSAILDLQAIIDGEDKHDRL